MGSVNISTPSKATGNSYCLFIALRCKSEDSFEIAYGVLGLK